MYLRLAAAIACLIPFSALAVPPTHTEVPSTNPNEAHRIFGLRIPFRVGPITSERQLTVDLAEGNAWQPVVGLEYPDSYKVYGADGVINSGSLRFTQQVPYGGEVEVGVTMFMLVRGENAANYMVSDDFIENFHSAVLPWEDPFQRRAAGINQTGIIFRDREGKVREYGRNDVFLGTLDLAYVKYIELIRNDRVLLTLRLGAYAGIPLNDVNEYVAVGAAPSIASTIAMTRNLSVTAGLGATAQYDRALKIHDNGVDFADRPYTLGYQGLLALNIDTAKGTRVSFGFELMGMTAPISKKLVEKPTRAENLGFEHAQAGQNLSLQRSFDSVATFVHDATFFISYRPRSFKARKGRPALPAPTFTIYAQEDWIPFANVTRGSSYFIDGGDNAQDFGMGLRVRIPLP